MLSERMLKKLNKQIDAEMFASQLYLSMSAYFDSIDLPGFRNWMRVQAVEERGHALKFVDYIHNRDSRVLIGALDAPPHEWKSPLAALEAAYTHEQKVTGMIDDLKNTAVAEKDHATSLFLDWFVKEQVEEESSSRFIAHKLRFIGDAPSGILLLDRELSARTGE